MTVYKRFVQIVLCAVGLGTVIIFTCEMVKLLGVLDGIVAGAFVLACMAVVVGNAVIALEG